MWIGSPLRGAFRLFTYVALTLVLLPIYLLALTDAHPAGYPLDAGAVPPHGVLHPRHPGAGARHALRRTPTLFVCNHVSYLDIEVMGGLVPGSFVAKAEVATWPFISTLRQGAAHDLHRAQVGQDQRQPATR
jgi:1-acyl-sn-glycerol-3-phosphate acyltransferase